MIRCRICDRLFSRVTNTHLAAHGLNVDVYREKFPDAPLVSRQQRHKRKPQKCKRLIRELLASVGGTNVSL